jgi:hypothetical protein
MKLMMLLIKVPDGVEPEEVNEEVSEALSCAFTEWEVVECSDADPSVLM